MNHKQEEFSRILEGTDVEEILHVDALTDASPELLGVVGYPTIELRNAEGLASLEGSNKVHVLHSDGGFCQEHSPLFHHGWCGYYSKADTISFGKYVRMSAIQGQTLIVCEYYSRNYSK